MDEQKVFSFIDRIEDERNSKTIDDKFKNSINYKYKCLDKAKEDCKEQCLSRVFEKFYRDAIPLNDDYKSAYNSELNSDVSDFVKGHGCEKLSYYIGEARKRGCVPACRIMESVEKLVDDTFKDREINISNCDPADLVFKMDDDTEKKIDVISRDLELDDLAKVISDNVKNTAISEITRAKQEKDTIKELESELANDINVNTESAIEFQLELRGYSEKKLFQPSLFEGIMINKLNKASLMQESGENKSVYLYGALIDYGMESPELFASPEEIAFVESVREYTILSVVKSLKLDNSLNNLQAVRELAQEYAMN